MENTSYALYIAAGVLIAIVILSVIIFRWRQLGSLESAKDEAIVIKNKAEFNREFEAFNKGLMYGTDVLSCLNKAQNNNQKYVYNNYYGTETESIGTKDRAEYFMDIEVTLNSALSDSIKAYYKDGTGKYQRVAAVRSEYSSNYNDLLFKSGTSNHFDDPTIYYYYFKQGKVYQETIKYTDAMWTATDKNKKLSDILSTGEIKTRFVAGTYHLLTDEDTSSVSSRDETAKLAALITTVSLKNQTIFNKEQPSHFDGSDWWYCTWTTAASDFKSRKFKCTGAVYNQDTGYIEKLSFEEI